MRNGPFLGQYLIDALFGVFAGVAYFHWPAVVIGVAMFMLARISTNINNERDRRFIEL